MKTRHILVFLLFTLAALAAEWISGGHPHPGFEHPGFFLWFGFASSLGLVLVSLLLGKLIKRRDDYYDD